MNCVSLPWPHKALSPNFRSRSHWPRTNAIANARTAAWALAKSARLSAPDEGPIQISVEFCPPDRRHRDLDNMFASFKAYQDGIADAVGRNDSAFEPTYLLGEPVKGGAVRVSIA